MDTGYFVCYRRDGEKEYFNDRCNYINAVFDSKAILFKEKDEVLKEEVVLAIIPIDNIAAIMRYEK